MSKEFDIIKGNDMMCASCTFKDSCKLLKFLNGQAKTAKQDVFDGRFYCSFYEKQPIQLPKVTERWNTK